MIRTGTNLARAFPSHSACPASVASSVPDDPGGDGPIRPTLQMGLLTDGHEGDFLPFVVPRDSLGAGVETGFAINAEKIVVMAVS